MHTNKAIWFVSYHAYFNLGFLLFMPQQSYIVHFIVVHLNHVFIMYCENIFGKIVVFFICITGDIFFTIVNLYNIKCEKERKERNVL